MAGAPVLHYPHQSEDEDEESGVGGIEGMESVVATVSGYHGSERFNLIKIISQMGASYVGALSRSTTHLVCWKFEGKKYRLAQKFDILIVNHKWIEDCLKKRKRVREHPYLLLSGQEVGPLSLEVASFAEKVVPLAKRGSKVFYKQSNACADSKTLAIDRGHEPTSDSVWIDSCLLNEVRKKKSICEDFRSTTSSKPQHKCRRLMSRKASKDILSSTPSNSEDGYVPLKVLSQHNNITVPINFSGGMKNGDASRRRTTSSYGSHDSGANGNDGGTFRTRGTTSDYGNEGSEENQDLNDNLDSGSPNLHSALEKRSETGCPDKVEVLAEQIKDESQIENTAVVPPSVDLSCVICWTDFSSTRGILPCGHRFCYSCIENWAGHMASRRKTSTCPLCKASFGSITKVDDVASSDQKIYSQTIPCGSSKKDVFVLCNEETPTFGARYLMEPVCSECNYREPVDLLISCDLCQIRCIHSYCLDPFLLPWTCIHCTDLRMLYRQFR